MDTHHGPVLALTWVGFTIEFVLVNYAILFTFGTVDVEFGVSNPNSLHNDYITVWSDLVYSWLSHILFNTSSISRKKLGLLISVSIGYGMTLFL